MGVGETTSGLDIKIEGVPQDATDKDAFNVVVIYERTPAVQYMEDGSVKLDDEGNPMPDWNYSVKQIQRRRFHRKYRRNRLSPGRRKEEMNHEKIQKVYFFS
mgnify:CR=1 FL=1